jgi:hypothetical protein
MTDGAFLFSQLSTWLPRVWSDSVPATTGMRTLALFAFAALAFSIFVGVIGVVWARRAQGRFLEEAKTPTVLHPLTRHRLRRLRDPLSWRVLYHVKLCLAFLLATYVGMLLLKTVRSFVARLL